MKIKNYFILGCLTLATIPAMAETYYPLNFDASTNLSRSDRHFDGISLTVDGTTQSKTRAASSPYPAYIDFTNSGFSFKAKPGDTLTPSAAYTGAWMHNYIYIDYNNNGYFEAKINADGTIPADSCEIVAFSNYSADGSNWYNSAGVSTDRASFTSPAFTIPAETPFGMYRLRTKIDWNNYDPAGCVVSTNHIVTNGGGIIDYLINIHGDNSIVNAVDNENGTITAADGSAISNVETAFGEPYTIKVTANEDLVCTGLTIKYGYNLDGDETDQYGNPQHFTVSIPSTAISGGSYTIPAEYMDANVSIEASFGEKVYYPSNYTADTEATHASRRFYSLKLTSTSDGEQLFDNSENLNKVYSVNDFTFKAKAGDTVTPVVKMSETEAAWMNSYIYIDYNNDAEFNAAVNADATLPEGSELVAFSAISNGVNYVNNKGIITWSANLQSGDFVIPEDTENGIYRLRAKIDWANSDPAGSESLLGNGGGIIDCFVNVHGDNSSITAVPSEDGEITDSANVALSTAEFGKAFPITITPNENYVCTGLTIKYGYNLDGDAVNKLGNPQYKTVEVASDEIVDGVYTIPAEYMDSNVEVSASYEYIESSAIANTSKNAMKVIPGCGTITINTAANTSVVVVDTLGRIVAKTVVNGSKTINVVPGLYIVNNVKVIVR